MPAPPPATAPIPAPFLPPAIAPMTAPTPAPPAMIAASRFVEDSAVAVKVSVVIATDPVALHNIGERETNARPALHPARPLDVDNTAPNLRPFRKKRAPINDYGFCQARQKTIAG